MSSRQFLFYRLDAGCDVTPLQDVWAFGVVLFVMLTGDFPFRVRCAFGDQTMIRSRVPLDRTLVFLDSETNIHTRY